MFPPLLLQVTPILWNDITPISRALDSALSKGFHWFWLQLTNISPSPRTLAQLRCSPFCMDMEPALCVFYSPIPDLIVPWVFLGPQHPLSRIRCLATCYKAN